MMTGDNLCPTCGENFPTDSGMKQHHTKVHGRSLIRRECENCSLVYNRQDGGSRFCSRNCFTDFHTKERECNICGDTFEEKSWRLDSRGKKTCGNENCIRKSTSETLNGHHVSQDTKEKISSALEGRSPWCKGQKRSKETKEKISRTKRQRNQGGTLRNSRILVDTGDLIDSNWERDIIYLLKSNNIDYQNCRNENITFDLDERNYTPDFKINDFILEVKGYGYWKESVRRLSKEFMQKYQEYTYLVVGEEIPCDIYVDWENRENIVDILNDDNQMY